MGRAVDMSVMGLYEWDNTLFDLLTIPSALNRDTLIQNILIETAELEVLYPNPTVFKNLIGVWSNKQIDIWNRLYATTQYEYNPIENYNRYETGSTDGTGTTTHGGTDATTETIMHSGTDGRTEAVRLSGSDTITGNLTADGSETKDKSVDVADGGTESEATTGSLDTSGSDTVSGTDTKGHWIAGFDATPSGQNDGLVKQTRDEDTASTTTAYGKEEDSTSSKTTTFGKTVDEDTTENNSYEKSEDTTTTTAYGKVENVTESKTYGQTIGRQESIAHGETVETTNEGSHELHAHGNIGVTTTQKLIREQRDIERFNLYDIITEDFKMRFCILIY